MKPDIHRPSLTSATRRHHRLQSFFFFFFLCLPLHAAMKIFTYQSNQLMGPLATREQSGAFQPHLSSLLIRSLCPIAARCRRLVKPQPIIQGLKTRAREKNAFSDDHESRKKNQVTWPPFVSGFRFFCLCRLLMGTASSGGRSAAVLACHVPIHVTLESSKQGRLSLSTASLGYHCRDKNSEAKAKITR